MTNGGSALARVAAIAGADFRIRFRRLSTLIIFVLLSGFAWIWVPAPSSGMALMQIDGKRLLYNTAAVATGTATLAAVFVGLIGFYVISNAVARDLRTRCGTVIASTTTRTAEYILGKFAGNVLFLVTFLCGFMVTSMGMLLTRGEAPLEPALFVWHYILIVGPGIVLVSATALLFESIGFLSGRFGDVFYFFFFMATVGVAASLGESGPYAHLARCLDMNGLIFVVDSVRSAMHANDVSIGSSPFNRAAGVAVFHGLQPSGYWLLLRLISLLLPLLLLPVAAFFFHRFDPARVRAGDAKQSRGWWAMINRWFKPLTRRLMQLAIARGGQSFVRGAISDAILTLTTAPLLTVAIAILSAVTAMTPVETARRLLSVLLLILAILIASVSTRDAASGTMGLILSAPRLRQHFVLWKALSAAMVIAPFTVFPILRLLVAEPRLAAALGIGVLFTISVATLLGIISTNAKAFLALFLPFWYLVVNDHGATPALDFAGFNGAATVAVVASYALVAAGLLMAAGMVWRVRLQD